MSQIERAISLVLAAVLCSLTVIADENTGERKEAAWNILSTLEGEWVAQEGSTGEIGRVAFSYKLTSTGNAVLETYDPGLPTEEITSYYHDGDKLLLTHFCALGNQARMILDASVETKALFFSCIGPTNVDSENDGHMHRMSIKIVDADHIETVWTMHKNGEKIQDFPFKLERKKDETER